MKEKLKTRDVPTWMKVVLAILTIFSAVTAYTSTFSDEVDRISVESAEGQIVIDNIEKSINTIQQDLRTVQTSTNENTQSISSIEANIDNLEYNQGLVNKQLTRMNSRLDKIIDLLLENQSK